MSGSCIGTQLCISELLLHFVCGKHMCWACQGPFAYKGAWKQLQDLPVVMCNTNMLVMIQKLPAITKALVEVEIQCDVIETYEVSTGEPNAHKLLQTVTPIDWQNHS